MEFLNFLSDSRSYLGVEIPRVIEWAVLTIAFVFSIISCYFVVVFRHCSSQLGKAQKLIDAVDDGLTKYQLGELTEQFSKIKLIFPMWREFRKTVVPERMGDDSARIFATRQSEEFFTFARLVDHPLETSVFLAVPGVMTSLGLLGTFLALFVGLNGLSVQASGEVHGIDKFITALSGKFVSSILGLFLALVSLAIVRVCVARLYKRAGVLQASINHAFERYPQETILLEMLRQLEDQSSAYKSFSADLAGQIKSSFHEDIGNLAETMNGALATLNANISEQGNHFRSFSEAFSPLVKESMKEGLEPGIQAVQQSLGVLSSAADELKAQKAESSQEMMEKMLSKFQESLTGSAGSQFTKLGEVLSETATFSQQMNAQIRDFLGEMKLVMEVQHSGMNQQRGALEDSIAKMLSNFDSISTNQLQNMQQQLSNIVQQTEVWTQKFSNVLEEKTGQQANQFENFVTGVKQAQEEYVASTTSSMNHILKSVSSHTAGVENSVIRIVERMDSHAQALSGLTTSVTESAKEFDGVMARNTNLISQLKTVSDSLQQTASYAKEASASLNSSTGTSSQAAERLLLALNSSGEVFAKMQQVLKDHNDLYSTLDEKFSRATQQISAALVTYNKVTSEGLNKHLTEFDSALTSACTRLGETVESIEGPIDELAEVISKATSTATR